MLIFKLLGYILVERMYKYLYSESKPVGRELSGNVTLTPGWSDRMQGKEDDKVEGFLNVKDLRRQTTANEEKLVISASANGNNQSGNSSTPECSSLISVMRQKVLLTFLMTIKKPSIFDHISLLIQLHIFTNSSLNLFLASTIVIPEEVKQLKW